jgi:hypothetical protein
MDHGPTKIQIHLELRGRAGGLPLFARILLGAAFLVAFAVLFLFVALGAATIISTGLILAMVVVFRSVVSRARHAARARDNLLSSSTATHVLPGLPHNDGGVAQLDTEHRLIEADDKERRSTAGFGDQTGE